MTLVKIDGRVFVVSFGKDGRPRAIKERKVFMPGTYMASVYNAPYWHETHGLGGDKSMPVRILREVKP